MEILEVIKQFFSSQRRRTLIAPDIRDGICGGTQFQQLPAATTVAAGSDQLTVTVGTGTEVTGRDTKGRANFKSQASTPADNDNVLVVPANTTNILNQPVSATATWKIFTTFCLNTITALFASVGMNESITDADPTGTAGDGVMVFFIPNAVNTNELANEADFVAAGITAAQRANFILAFKVAGVDTFAATNVAVVAGRDYLIGFAIRSDRRVYVEIDGVVVGKSPVLTDAAALRFMAGLELTTTPGGQKDFSSPGVLVHRAA